MSLTDYGRCAHCRYRLRLDPHPAAEADCYTCAECRLRGRPCACDDSDWAEVRQVVKTLLNSDNPDIVRLGVSMAREMGTNWHGGDPQRWSNLSARIRAHRNEKEKV